MTEPNSVLLDPAALAGMGIRQQPFAAPDEDRLYVDESLDLQIRMLRHNLQYSNMLQVLYGRPGAGKTTLTIRLVSVINQELELFLVRGERGLTSSRIIADLLRALEHETTADSTTDVEAFTRELVSISNPETPAALVVDDAHLLERRELEQLLANTVAIDKDSRDGFRLLLVGEPPLRDKLEAIESPLLAAGRVYAADIKPFSIEQASAYLAHRLGSVGASWPFDDEEVASIAESAEGLPGAIDRIAATALNHRHAEPTVVPAEASEPAPEPGGRPGMIRMVAAAAVLAAVAAWTLWPEPEEETAPELRTQPLALPDPPPVPSAEPVFKDEVAVANADQEIPLDTAPPQTEEPPIETQALDTEPPDSAETSQTAAPPPPLEPEPAAEPPTVTAPPQPVAEPEDAVSTEPATMVQAQPPEEAPAASPPAAPEPAARPRDRNWLQQQRKDHYVVQLMAAHDRQILQEFIRDNALGSQAAVFSTLREGLPWHVLLYGLYANADVARASIAELPTPLRRHSPWIRSLASVHKAIRDKTP